VFVSGLTFVLRVYGKDNMGKGKVDVDVDFPEVDQEKPVVKVGVKYDPMAMERLKGMQKLGVKVGRQRDMVAEAVKARFGSKK